MAEDNKYDQIEAYLEGSLEGKALARFEEQLINDQELAAKVALYKDVDPVLADKKALELQKITQDLGADFFSAETTTRPKIRKLLLYRRPLAIAASSFLSALPL